MAETFKKLFSEAQRGKRQSDKLIDELEKQVNQLNKATTVATRKLYNRIFAQLDLSPSSGSILNNTFNFSKVHDIQAGLEGIHRNYRESYGKIVGSFRMDFFESIAEKEKRIAHTLKENGVEEIRSSLSDEGLNTLQILQERNFRAINTMLLTWKEKVYDWFIDGIARNLDIAGFQKLFYMPDGEIRVGSSLKDASDEAIKSAVGQRVAFSRQVADERGYDVVFNTNPMDIKTKPICADATCAGVIGVDEMTSDYGWPPRYICRCDVTFLRSQWTEFNQAINDSVRQQRLNLLDELYEAPKTKSSWIWNGMKVFAPDGGGRMYKEIEDKIKFVEALEVPDYEAP